MPSHEPTPLHKVRVLFVCLGNICRSPTAEGVFRDMAAREGLGGVIGTDSAGTGSWHIGDPPDPRAQASAKKRGYDISGLRARQTRAADFDCFDYILAMDRSNFANMRTLNGGGTGGKLHLFLDFADGPKGREVPDPYYGDQSDYEKAFGLIEAASRGLLAHIQAADLA